MASNSIIPCVSSSCDLIRRYDVFVSFRGDTRNNFTDHLFGALHSRGINFFRDDTKLKKGKHILPELLRAIEGSQILVVVFSKKYASSKWCLRELEKIANCIKISEKHVLPIFYNITPSEVRNQSGDYKEAFDEYEKRFREDKDKMEEVQRWRQALSQVANLSGWDIGNKPQYREIKNIVQSIQKILQQYIVCSSNVDLVGIESRVEELEKLLLLDSDDIVMSLGVCGMTGMGKTTLVTTLCQKIHSYFEFHYFIEDVSQICQNSSIYGLRKHLLCQDLEENSMEIYNMFPKTNLVSDGRRLIVLDNVGHIEQLEKLNLNHKCLSPGSRIIIISADRRILEDYGVNPIYHVGPLNQANAIQLFYKYAFNGNCVMSEYEKLKYDVLSYCEGHPLLIKVLGRHLANQDVLRWQSAIAKLREIPKKDIRDKLQISFDGLEQNEKELFLDIACFYDWYQYKNNMMEVLQVRGFEPESGLKILLEKSLITSYSNMWVEMPRLLIDLGKYIVKEKSPKEPREWSRLWDCEDLLKILLDNKASKNLEAIIVERAYCKNHIVKIMKVAALSKMSQLKFLILPRVKCEGSLNDLSNELRYLIWNEYPLKYLPPNFQPNNLVKLVMRDSNIKRLWKGTKALPNLKYLDLRWSKNLVKMPNFEEAPNLKWLSFEGCIQLRNIHPSIGSLGELTCLNLKDCKSVESLPASLLGLSSLEYLNLSGCSKLYNTHLLKEAWDAKHFNKPRIGAAPIHSQSTSSIQKKLFICWASSLVSSPTFPYLRHLGLSFCNLHQIPDAIGDLCYLEWLILAGNKFEKMPSLKKLSKLVYINLEHCKKLKYLFELPSQTDLKSEEDDLFLSMIVENSNMDHFSSKGLNMFNCRKLVQSEEWSRMIISWMIQLVKTNNEHRVESVIPGNEIPRWFNNQHVAMGDSIIVNGTPLRQDEDNWIGIAFCVVFCISHHGEDSIPIMSRPRTKLAVTHFIEVLVDVDLLTDKSDHMYLFYISRSDLGRTWRLLHFDEIDLYFDINDRDWHCEVKKYGYRWVYESDLHLSNIPSNHSYSSSNRKRKISEIKEK